MTGNTELSKRDALETVFSAMEGSCCPGSSYKPEPTPDSLDYVFENVGESSVMCRAGKLFACLVQDITSLSLLINFVSNCMVVDRNIYMSE